MIAPTSDCRQLVPVPESTATLKLVLHRNIPGDAPPARGSDFRGDRRREARPDTPPLHQPTPAECYGCVEWFHY